MTETKDLIVKESTELQMIHTIAEMVKQSDIDVEKIDKLLDVQIRMMDRQAKMDYDQALCNVQSKVPRITARGEIKNKNGQVTSRYMTYEDIDKIIRPLLQEEGFSVLHNRRDDNGKMIISTVLKHRTGHQESVETPLPYDAPNALKNSVQAAVSTYSYGKRINVCSLLNIVAEGEDDDGQLSEANKITADQATDIKSIIEDLKKSGVAIDEVKFVQYLKAESIDDIAASKYTTALELLKRKAKGVNNAETL